MASVTKRGEKGVNWGGGRLTRQATDSSSAPGEGEPAFVAQEEEIQFQI